MTDAAILIGKGEKEQWLPLRFANRHGLIAGATGTGKTITLQVLAEGFSRAGVPVFAVDVKGDLSGIAQAGTSNPRVDERVKKLGIPNFSFAANPAIFWDIYGKQGHPARVTISEMGPLLLGRLLQLSEAQQGVLHIVFRVADEQGLLLLDLKDLREMLTYVGENDQELRNYGHISAASVATVQRALLQLEDQGAERLFGEPALALADLMRFSTEGHGYVNILAANELIQSPAVYATFLLWLLAELFETLPEVGDPDKPKLVLFFDEAHLLFEDTPKALQDKIEQVVRLIRSKGVGVYFITQNPADIPDDVLGQLSNRVQHALRAYTPKERQAVKAATQSFRPNPAFDTETVIAELGVGEALVSTLQENGAPGIVERALICPPGSRIGALTAEERQQVMAGSPVGRIYDQAVDKESAYEKLATRAQAAAAPTATRVEETVEQEEVRTVKKSRQTGSTSNQEFAGKLMTTTARRVATRMAYRLGTELVRGAFGLLKR